MARKLNTRLLVMVGIFAGVPLLVVLYLVFGGAFSRGDPQELYKQAQTFYEKEEYPQAWIAIRNSIRAGGARDPDILFHLAKVAMKQKPPAVGQAIQACRNVVDLKPDHLEAQTMLAELYVAVRYWAEAKIETAKLIKLDPSFGKAYVWGGLVAVSLAEAEPIRAKKIPYFEEAAATCRAGIEKAPKLIELYRLLASVYQELGRDDDVDEVINLAVANNPTVAEAYLLKAERLASLDRTDEAADVLKKGVETVGEDAKLYMGLGNVAGRKRDFDLAKEYFQKAIAADPKETAAYIRLSAVHRTENDREGAIAVLEQGIGAMPDSAALLAEQADLHLELGNVQEAQQRIAQIEKLKIPDQGTVAYLKGKQALLQRQLRVAITYLEQARNERPTPQGRLLLGRAYLGAMELGAAQTELESLAADYPRMTTAMRTLAEVQLRLRDFDRAARNAKVVLAANPGDTSMRLLLAQALVAQRKIDEATKEIKTAAELAKDDPDPYLLLADIYYRAKQNDQAEAAFRKAVDVGKDLRRVYQRFLQFYRNTDQQPKLDALLAEARKALPEDQFPGTTEEAEKVIRQHMADGTATVGHLISLARVCQLTDRVDEATDLYRQALAKAEPKTVGWRQAWQQLFLLNVAGSAYDKAAELIDQLKKAEPDAPELLFADPLLLLGQGKYQEAADQIRVVLAKYKTLSQGHYLLGQVLVRQRKWDEAVAALGRALEMRPNLVEARLLLGRVYHMQGNYSGELTEANEALKYDRRLVSALEMKAVAHAGLGDWPSALQAREEIAQLVPDNVGNLIALATLNVQKHDPVKAEEAFGRAYKLAPDSPLLVRAFADFYAGTSRPQKGEQIIAAYVEKHAGESKALLLRGEYVAKISGPAEAETHFRKAAEMAPDDPYPLMFLGDAYSQKGQWQKAAEVYRESVQRAGKDDLPRKRLADVYMLQGKLDEARQVIEAVLANNKEDAAALVVAGRIASRQGDVDTAKGFIEKALSLSPDYGEAKVRLAELHAGPDPLRALDILSDVDPTDPAFEKAMLLRADINTRRVQLTEAILDLRRLLDFRPTSITGRMQLASKYMATRQPQRAAEILAELSKEKRNQDPNFLVALGDALTHQQKYADALQAYEQARALKPDLPEALIGEVRSLASLGRADEALKRVRHVMNIFSRALWPRMALVAVYERTGELEKAFEALRNGLLVDSKWEVGYGYLADLLVRAKRVDEARQVLLTGLQNVPTSTRIRAGLAAIDMEGRGPATAIKILKPLADEFAKRYAVTPEKVQELKPYLPSIRIYSLALYRAGRSDEALDWGMKLWALDPTDVANANNMAWILATERKDLEQATDMIRRALRLVPNHAQILDTAGWIAFLDRRYDDAIENLMDSIKYGDNAEARYHLGRVYEDRGRPDDARTDYQKALDLGLAGKERQDAEKRLKAIESSAK